MGEPEHWLDCDGNGSVDCPDCHGEGGYHDCGEDCCACLDPEGDLNDACETREGSGILHCPGCREHYEAMDDAEGGTVHGG